MQIVLYDTEPIEILLNITKEERFVFKEKIGKRKKQIHSKPEFPKYTSMQLPPI